MRVTIAIAAYNAAETIEQAVRSALAQTEPCAVIVADDGSDDGTADLAEAAGATVLRCPHRGRADTFNMAWEAADTEWVYFLGADDWMDPDTIAAYLATLDANPHASMLYGDIEMRDRFDEPRGNVWQYEQHTPEELREAFRINGQSPIPSNASCLWRKRTLEQLGGFKFPICTDTELLQRALVAPGFKPVHVPGARYHYRWDPAKVKRASKAKATIDIFDQIGQMDAAYYLVKWLGWNRSEAARPFLEKALQLEPGEMNAIVHKIEGPKSKVFLACIDQDGGPAFIKRHAAHWTKRWDVTSDIDQADLIFVEWCANALVEISRRPKLAPIIARLHSYEMFTDFPDRVNWERVDALAFVSRTVEDYIRDHYALNVPSVWMPNGVDLTKFTIPPGKRWDTKRIAFLANLSAKKGPMLLAQVIAALPDGYSVHIAGRIDDPRFKFYLDDFVRKGGYEDRVEWCGYVEDVPGWLRDKSFVLATSPFESFGLGIAEAVACGCIPLVHDWPGADDWWGNWNLWQTPEGCVRQLTKSNEANAEEYSKEGRAELPTHADSLAASTGILEAAMAQTGPHFIVGKDQRFLEPHEFDGYIEGKRKAHKRVPGIDRVVIHMPPNGGFRYIQQNYALAFEALGYDVRVLDFGANDRDAALDRAHLVVSACSDPYNDDLGGFNHFLAPCVLAASPTLPGAAERVSGDFLDEMSLENFLWSPVHPTHIEAEHQHYTDLGLTVRHLPYAAMPTVHHHVRGRIREDIGFIGTYNPTKAPNFDKWIRPIMQKRRSLVAGVGFPGVGPIPQNQANRVYSLCRVCPNVHQDIQRGRRMMLNERTFVIPACGGFEIVDWSECLEDYFEPNELLGARDPEHMATIVESWIRQPRLRLEAALAGHHRVLRDHSYLDRVTEVMSWLV
jgi:glycosyltransferase involved in cell wall biosynthesis